MIFAAFFASLLLATVTLAAPGASHSPSAVLFPERATGQSDHPSLPMQ
jgi:hypothetical protein